MAEFGEEIGKHTIKKWNLLQNYLQKYTEIMSNRFWRRFFYVDAFAGKGKYGNYDGSTLIALGIKYPFTDYVYIEKNRNKFTELQENVSKALPKKTKTCRNFPPKSEKDVDVKVSIKNEDANLSLPKLFGTLIPNGTHCFVFLDPEGLELKIETVESCSKIGGVELLINFPVGGVIRNMEIEKSVSSINGLYGSDDWKKNKLGSDGLEENLANLYMSKINPFFKHLNYSKICNENNIPVYYLIHATNNDAGNRIMAGAMRFGQRKLETFTRMASKQK